MTRSDDILTQWLWPLVSRSLNRALQYAPAARARLKSTGPQIWRLHLEDLGWHVDITSDGDSLHLHPTDDAAPDAEIRGHSKDFLALLQSQDKTAALASSPIRVEGSTGSFMQLQALVDDLDIDWEAWLGDLIGDLPAHQFAALSRTLWGDIKSGATGVQHATERYLIREKRLLVTRPEAETLMQSTHALRRRLDRAAASIRQLKKQRGNAAAASRDDRPNRKGD